jgi:hypothetical protein
MNSLFLIVTGSSFGLWTLSLALLLSAYGLQLP